MLSIRKIYLTLIKIYHFWQKEKKLFNLHWYISFLPERKKLEKVEKLVCDIEHKNKKNVVHIRDLKQALNTKSNSIIQETWLKPYIDMNTWLRKEANNEFEKYFFKLMNNSVFGKTMEM